MPMLVRLWWLPEARSFARRFALPSGEQPCLRKNPPHGRGADGPNIRVQHQERQPPVAFQGMVQVITDDGLFLPRLQPKIPESLTVVLIDAPIAFSPVVEFAGAHTQSVEESSGTDLGLF
jgi:hypothetical protein